MKVDITNLYEDVTGIEGRVVINSKSHGQKTPCLRYYVQDIEISVSIEDNPKAMLPNSIDGSVSTKYEGIVSWIILNRDDLLSYWTHEIDSDELSERLLYAGLIQNI